MVKNFFKQYNTFSPLFNLSPYIERVSFPDIVTLMIQNVNDTRTNMITTDVFFQNKLRPLMYV